jgi:hypothetical protein
MSWVQWQGEVWRTSAQGGEIYVHFAPPEGHVPGHSWYWDFMHIEPPLPGQERDMETERWLDVKIEHIGFGESDWRELSRREVRSDRAWWDSQESSGYHGRLEVPHVTALCPLEGQSQTTALRWVGHDFILRFGERDGLIFPSELDAWVEPESDYFREKPETEEDVARWPQSPPNLRVITTMRFVGGSVRVPREAADPVAAARDRLSAELRCSDFHRAEVKWALRSTRDHSGVEPMPGWSSTVHFSTRE